MKKIFILAMAAILSSCAADAPRYVIEGEASEGTYYLFVDRQVVDSAVVENGKFRFEGEIPASPVCNVANAADLGGASQAALVILESGVIFVKESGDATGGSLQVSGTPANDANTAYSAAAKALREEYRNPETSEERRKAIAETEYDQLTHTAYEANRTNYFGAIMLSRMSYELSGQEILDEIAKFSPEMQQLEIFAKLKANAEKKIRTEVGNPYINFSQPDKDGNAISLQSVIENPANKYVLVDFWASWCGPCMAEVPALKAAYDAYKAKGFEIFGVSLDKDREKWLNAIESKKLNWLHVSDLKAWENAAAADYAVRSIPSNFLVECATGKIVASQLRGDDVSAKIAELLAQ